MGIEAEGLGLKPNGMGNEANGLDNPRNGTRGSRCSFGASKSASWLGARASRRLDGKLLPELWSSEIVLYLKNSLWVAFPGLDGCETWSSTRLSS